jgi:peptide/nickel transport system permease protein
MRDVADIVRRRPSWMAGARTRAASVARVLLVLVTTYLGLLAVTFFIGRVVPIDPVIAAVGDRAPEHVVERTRKEMRLDLPLSVQFATYVGQVLSGDLGISVLTANPVASDLARVFPATLELATVGTLLGVCIGIPLGVFAAVRRGSLLDQLVRLIGLIGYSVPIFWMALLGLVIFYARLKWISFPGRMNAVHEYSFTPITGLYLLDALIQRDWVVALDVVRHMALPAALLGFFSLAYISRMTRSLMLTELSQEYVVTARAKGLSDARIIWAHALRNAAVPLVTVVILTYAGLLEGSVLTETVFSWPGIGLYITNSLQSADMNAVLGGTLVVGSVFILLNVASDLLYRVIDPRTRMR